MIRALTKQELSFLNKEHAKALAQPPARDDEVWVVVGNSRGEALETFRVQIDGGWPPFKVAAEIKHTIENAYRVEE